MNASFSIEPAGDSAFLLRFGDEIAVSLSEQVLAAAAEVERARPEWLVDVVPAYASLLVIVDPLRTDPAEARAFLERAAAATGPAPAPGRAVTVPVHYGGEAGPDLEAVASETGMTAAEVVRLHTSVRYRVYMLGFKPGFPYMGTLPAPLRVPRLASPRTRVPAGSVGIAGAQTGIYPVESPGGWRLLGRTPLRLFDPDRPAPFLLRPGDIVTFVPVVPVVPVESGVP